ncbi:MAG TPA: hypothetical protein VFH47_05750 [Candidatus Thermoplasmatota archaeon]|nr:hypothetical protein [Candidatus Thermoplasmatota archaeon]
MRATTFLCLAVAGALLAGCVAPSTATLSGQGYQSGTQSRSIECGSRAYVTVGTQGTGPFAVTVTDGAGRVVYEESSTSAGQGGQSQELRGEKGTWTVQVSTGVGYAGQYAVTLGCLGS